MTADESNEPGDGDDEPETATDPLDWTDDGSGTTPDGDEDASAPASSPLEGSASGSDDPAAAPLEDVAEAAGERAAASSSVPETGLFEEREVTGIDADAVWERIDADAERADDVGDGRDVRIVETADYCANCPYFSAPPAVSCGHEGTQILEVLDMERFRVADCPKVRETDRLERL